MEQPARNDDHCVSDDVCSADNHDRGGAINDDRVYDEHIDPAFLDFDVKLGLKHIYCTYELIDPGHVIVHHDHRYPSPEHYWGIEHHGSDDDGRGESHTANLDNE